MSASNLYYYALLYLYCILADESFLFDSKDIDYPPEGNLPLGTYMGPHLSELFEWFSNETINYDSEVSKEKDTERLMDDLTADFLGPIWHLARFMNTKYSEISVGKWIEYFYYQAVIQILDEFISVMQNSIIRRSYFYSHYMKYHEKIKKTQYFVKSKSPNPNSDGYNSKEINDFIKKETKRLAIHWKNKVYESL